MDTLHLCFSSWFFLFLHSEYQLNHLSFIQFSWFDVVRDEYFSQLYIFLFHQDCPFLDENTFTKNLHYLLNGCPDKDNKQNEYVDSEVSFTFHFQCS